MSRILRYILFPLLSCCIVACSTTAHIPDDEVLYTGVSGITRHPSDTVDAEIDEAMALALEVPPTNSLFGSAYHQSPLPIGLWAYNAFYPEQETGFRHWLWKVFKAEPKYISTVNPRLRAQAAEAILKDEGYFDAIVTYDTLFNKKDSMQAKLAYDVTYHHQTRLGSINFLSSPSISVDNILRQTQPKSLLRSGDRFSASKLEEEKNRISAVMRDSGYFFFSPDNIKFLGDSTLAQNTVSLRVIPDVSSDIKSIRPCVIDSVFYHLDYGYGMKLQNSDTLGFVTIGYNNQQLVKTKYLQRALGFDKGALYNPHMAERVKTQLARLNAFQYTTTEFQVLNPEREQESYSLDPASDTLHLMLKVHAVNSMPWSGGMEVGNIYKDNQQLGPGFKFNAQRRNLFGGGEILSTELNGSYEWYTGKRSGKTSLPNSFELGAEVSYTIPRLPFQHLWHVNPDNPVSSRYSVSTNWQRRGGYFEMLKNSAAMEYTFTRGKVHTFNFTPFRLTYMHTLSSTERYDSILLNNIALFNSLDNQFIPQIQFTWTYNNAPVRQGKRSHQYLRLSAAEAGGLIDLMTGWWGTHKMQGERQLWNQRFSQFVKFTGEFSNTYHLTPRQQLVTRFLAGIGYAYGNSQDIPYSEQFYIGGANSLRGFSARSVGPGTLNLDLMAKELYIDNIRLYCVGDYKFEFNFEYRFPIAGNLYGALFTDIGNIFGFKSSHDQGVDRNLELCEDEEEFMLMKAFFSQLRSSYYDGPLFKQLAFDCGAGLRLDLGMLVVRFDVGVPIHDPNALEIDRFFNCRQGFFKHLGYNLAVGYPF